MTTGEGDAARMFAKKSVKAPHPSEETSAAFKSLSIFTGEDERFAYVSLDQHLMFAAADSST